MPLERVLVVTTAVKLPAEAGLVEKVIVSSVAVAAVTVPTAPSLKVTVLLAATISKPKPAIDRVVKFAAKLELELVTIGMADAT